MSSRLLERIGIVVAVAIAAAAGYGIATWQTSRMAGHEMPSPAQQPAGGESGRTVLYWYDPMYPQHKFDKPGKSPYMDMMLVPKYADDVSATGVKIDPAVRQNLGMRLAAVTRERVAAAVSAVATAGYDERNLVIVQTRSNAFVERVYAHAPADVVQAGTPLADLFVPDWAGAQHEYLALLAAGEEALAAAARSRMRLLGMSDALIERVAREGKPHTTITVTTPIAGVIQELGVRAGMTLAAGATLARIASIASVWLEAAVPEAQAGLVSLRAPVEARFAAYPQEVFTGRVTALLPEASRETRTLRVRIELANPGLRLRPGMFAEVAITGPAEDALVVPAEAVIRTGRRALVFVAGSSGELTPAEVELGPEMNGKLVVRRGLREGQQVVASGQFLIDSEASLRGILSRMQSPPSPGKGDLHVGSGTLDEVAKDEVTLSHGPIPSMRWGPMTMAFKLARPELASGLKAKDSVRFRFRQSGDDFVIEEIETTGGGR